MTYPSDRSSYYFTQSYPDYITILPHVSRPGYLVVRMHWDVSTQQYVIAGQPLAKRRTREAAEEEGMRQAVAQNLEYR